MLIQPVRGVPGCGGGSNVAKLSGYPKVIVFPGYNRTKINTRFLFFNLTVMRWASPPTMKGIIGTERDTSKTDLRMAGKLRHLTGFCDPDCTPDCSL
jgi:hypothetical protein